MKQEGNDLFKCHIRLLLSEDLPDNLCRSSEVCMLLLRHLNVMIALEVVQSSWDGHHWNDVHPGPFKLTLQQKVDEARSDVKTGSRCPQEGVVEHLHDS